MNTVDPDAVRALITYWLRHASDTHACSTPDTVGAAVGDALSEALEVAHKERASAGSVFEAGAEFGLSVALAVISEPLCVNMRVADAINAAEKTLQQYITDARDDAAMNARRSGTLSLPATARYEC